MVPVFVVIMWLSCLQTAGETGWGIAYWVDDMLIPELILTRGETYTFIVEAGDNTGNLAEYHPLYITDSLRGGRLFNTEAERMVSGIKHC